MAGSESNVNSLSYLVVLIIAAVYFISFKQQNNKYQEKLKQQALKRNGMLKQGLWTLAVFPFNDFIINVYVLPPAKSTPASTVFEAKIQMNHDCRFIIRLKKSLSCFYDKHFGYKIIRVDNPDFDQGFVVEVKNESIIKGFFNHEIQKTLSSAIQYQPLIHLDKKKFSLRFFSVPDNEQTFDHMIDCGLTCLKRLSELCIVRPKE